MCHPCQYPPLSLCSTPVFEHDFDLSDKSQGGEKRTFLYCVTRVVVHMDLFAQCNVWAIGRVFFGFLHDVVMAELEST